MDLGFKFITVGSSIACRNKLFLLIVVLTGSLVICSCLLGLYAEIITGMLFDFCSGFFETLCMSLNIEMFPSNCPIALIFTLACSLIEQLSLGITYLNSLTD